MAFSLASHLSMTVYVKISLARCPSFRMPEFLYHFLYSPSLTLSFLLIYLTNALPSPYFSGSAKPVGEGTEVTAAEIADPVDQKAQELVGTMSGDLQGLVDDEDDDEGTS